MSRERTKSVRTRSPRWSYEGFFGKTEQQGTRNIVVANRKTLCPGKYAVLWWIISLDCAISSGDRPSPTPNRKKTVSTAARQQCVYVRRSSIKYDYSRPAMAGGARSVSARRPENRFSRTVPVMSRGRRPLYSPVFLLPQGLLSSAAHERARPSSIHNTRVCVDK